MDEEKEQSRVTNTAVLEPERSRRLTEKAMEEKLQRCISLRRQRLRDLSCRMNVMKIWKNDFQNVRLVQEELEEDFMSMLTEFNRLNKEVMSLLPEDEQKYDQENWFEPKMAPIKDFMRETGLWIEAALAHCSKENGEEYEQTECAQLQKDLKEPELQDGVQPSDSASQIDVHNAEYASPHGSQVSRMTVWSRVSATRARQEAEHAALLERAAAMKKMQQLEQEEAELQRLEMEAKQRRSMEIAKIKAKKEQLEIDTALAESSAKLKVLKDYERFEDGASSQARESISRVSVKREATCALRPHLDNVNHHMQSRPPTRNQVPPVAPQDLKSQSSISRDDDLLRVMEKQNLITELLVKQQKQSQLPSKDIPLFRGNVLQYKSFIRAFEHAIEQKTDNDQDKLYFLEQFTSEEPQELVRSCIHMPPSRGYKEAKQLLHKHYGDELRIASAYIERALKWPQIKSEDGKALNAYAMFLVGCRNTMEDIESMEEMDNPTNLRTVVSKLPYRLKDRWRAEAFNIKQRQSRRARFADLVSYIENQAKIVTDPVFGEIPDNRSNTSVKNDNEKSPAKKEKRKSFATNVSTEKTKAKDDKLTNQDKKGNAFDKPCMYCQQAHTLATCNKIKNQPYKDRVEFLKSKGLCFGCLALGHISKSCKKRTECKECKSKHPEILHRNKENDSASQEKNNDAQVDELSPQASVAREATCLIGAGESECVLSIVPVKIKSRKSDKHVVTYAFMDPGSTATFITEDLRKQLNVKGKPTQLLLSTMSHNKSSGLKCINSYVITDLEVCGLEESKFIELPRTYTHGSIPVHKENIPKQSEIRKWPYLREVRLPEIQAEVGLLIGVNCPGAMEPWHVINSRQGGPYAVKTAIGWVVNGLMRKELNADHNKQDHCLVNRITVMEIEKLLVQQYNTDFPERIYDDKQEMSQDDKQFMQHVEKTTTFEDGHYCIGLPLKNDKMPMPNNRCVAEQRIISLRRKLMKDPKFYEDYKAFMDAVIKKGYAMRVPTDQLNRDDGMVSYIPHHGVYHPKKRKIRVVFDCAASFQEQSLNSRLLQGPDLTNTLIGVLLRFREEPVAMMADIESMFYQVKVPGHDADLQRFLWWPNGNLNEPLEEFRMTVHLFGATSSPSIASYALKRTAEDNQITASPEAVRTVMCNFYVDDCLKSVATEEEAVTLIKDLRTLCAKGGFTLTKWTSHNRKVLHSVPAEHRVQTKSLDLSYEALPVERALGIQWDTEADTFVYSIKLPSKPMTRRGILAVVNSIYDPLGLLAPVILPAKLLLKDLCKEKHGWDESISEKHEKAWKGWKEDVTHLSNFHVNRCVKPKNFGHTVSAQLHHFSDASEYAYGTASYLLLKNKQGQKCCSLVMGKSRVASLKQVTIPRLELTAAVVAVKIDKMLCQELQMPLQPSIFWTDSTTVLKYIDNDAARYKTFVANRIHMIREVTTPSQWKYVRTTENPADLSSRGMKARNLAKSNTWIDGPSFLRNNECEWPEHMRRKESLQDDPEVKNIATVNLIKVKDEVEPMNHLINYYSDWQKLKRALSWILKVKKTLRQLKDERKALTELVHQKEMDPEQRKSKIKNGMEKYKTRMEKKPLTLEDLIAAELEVIKYSQRQQFNEELQLLQKGKQVSRNSQLFKLDPVLQENILRVGGRLNKSAMPEIAKRPAIISKHSRVATLILTDIHQRTGHAGRGYVLATLRRKYWIPQANSAIRSMINKCVTCRRISGKTGEQKMADLPEDRLLPDKPPFTNTGVDFFGPFDVKRGRITVKRYGVLFTCLTLRAVHIEVADSLDTDSCINAIRRFVCRRGQVTIMRSDNGTNLVAAEKELKDAIKKLDNDKIARAFQPKGINWIFNSPAASHQGGVWERQIRAVRRILSSITKEQAMNDDCIQTMMCEVESIINGRPLTLISDDANDLEPLTPNHLLLLRSQPNMPPGIFNKDDMYSRKRWKQVQYLVDLFWTRWTREYLPLLQERQKWSTRRRNFAIGDVVLLVDNTSPRNSWLLGRVVDIMPDSSGIVRRVKIKTKTNILERPVNKLCLLEEAAQEETSS